MWPRPDGFIRGAGEQRQSEVHVNEGWLSDRVSVLAVPLMCLAAGLSDSGWGLLPQQGWRPVVLYSSMLRTYMD